MGKERQEGGGGQGEKGNEGHEERMERREVIQGVCICRYDHIILFLFEYTKE